MSRMFLLSITLSPFKRNCGTPVVFQHTSSGFCYDDHLEEKMVSPSVLVVRGVGRPVQLGLDKHAGL